MKKKIVNKKDAVVYSSILVNYQKRGSLGCDTPSALIWDIGKELARDSRYAITGRKLLGIDVNFVDGYGAILRIKTFAEGYVPAIESNAPACTEKTIFFKIPKKSATLLIGKDHPPVVAKPDKNTIIVGKGSSDRLRKELADMRSTTRFSRRTVSMKKAAVTDSIQLGTYARPDSVVLAEAVEGKGVQKSKMGRY